MPITYQSKEFKDISLSFKIHPVTKDILVLKNADAIKKSVMNLVRTNVGDRVYEKNLGTRTTSYLFETLQSGDELSLRREIETVIVNYEPRVRLIDVFIKIDDSSYSLEVGINYEIIGQEDIPQNVQFLLGN